MELKEKAENQVFCCKCEERDKPVGERAWVVTQYKWDHGWWIGQGRPSDSSMVRCLECGAVGRTEAGYVDDLKRMESLHAAFECIERSEQKKGAP